jgi:hypothetical protein
MDRATKRHCPAGSPLSDLAGLIEDFVRNTLHKNEDLQAIGIKMKELKAKISCLESCSQATQRYKEETGSNLSTHLSLEWMEQAEVDLANAKRECGELQGEYLHIAISRGVIGEAILKPTKSKAGHDGLLWTSSGEVSAEEMYEKLNCGHKPIEAFGALWYAQVEFKHVGYSPQDPIPEPHYYWSKEPEPGSPPLSP